MARYLLADIGSTFTKTAAVDAGASRLLATAESPTTIDTDINAGFDAATSPEPPPVTERDVAYLTDLYDSAVRTADASIGRLLERLDEQRLHDSTTLIITSDHGESLGEVHAGRRYFAHGGPPYEEQIRVPLVIRPSAASRSALTPDEIDQPVSLVDLVPTILDLAGIPYGREQFDGCSLVDLAAGQIAAFDTRSLVFHSCEDTSDRYLDPRLFGTALTWRRDGKLHYDHQGRVPKEFYRLDRDPGETDNVIDELEPDQLRRVDGAIAVYEEQVRQRARHPASAPIEDPVVLQRLADLGYIE